MKVRGFLILKNVSLNYSNTDTNNFDNNSKRFKHFTVDEEDEFVQIFRTKVRI